MRSTTSSCIGVGNNRRPTFRLQRVSLLLVCAMFVLLTLALSVSGRTSVVYAHGSEGMAADDVSQSDGTQADQTSDQTSMWLDAPWGTLPPPSGNALALYEADLSPANEVLQPDNISSGRAVFALVSDTISNSVYLRLIVNDYSDVTLSHIHESPPGVSGPPIVTLFDSSTDGSFSNPLTATVVLTDSEQISKLNNGAYYINIHGPDGNGAARGQIRPFTNVPTKFTALLMGGNERPNLVTTTSAVGVAYITLDPATGVLSYSLHVSDIVSITAGHIHRGGPENAGGVVVGLNTAGLAPGNPTSGTVTLDGQALVDLLTGHLYVNIHTSANPGGEIRGQIGGASLFEACLTGADEVAPVTTDASGKAVIALDADGSQAFYRLLVNDIKAVTGAHIHSGTVGTNGPVIIPIPDATSLSPSNPLSGVVPMAPTAVLQLLAGKFYVNVHTTANPGGEIRGQVLPLRVPGHLNALMTQAEEVPPSGVEGVGLVRLTLSDLLDRVNFTIVVTGVNDITAAHIHRGPRGVNGPAFVNLHQPETLSSTDPAGGGDSLSAQEWVDLLTGYAYANVHTGVQVKSVIRGQVGGVHTYWSKLNGLNEAPIPVATTVASGEAILAINPILTGLDYRMFVKDIPAITASHIHRGAAGVGGPVVTGLYTGTGVFDAANPLSGTASLKTNDVLDLIAGKLYLNVHTGANPGGEIRDQIRPYKAPGQFAASLSGSAEVPPVTSTVLGLAYMRLDTEMGHLSYSVAVTSSNAITDIKAAHIHFGAAGKNGPVVVPLYNSSTDGLFDATHPLGDCVRVGSKQIVDLLTGYWYVNVHTGANPGGELRGQVGELKRVYLPVVAKN